MTNAEAVNWLINITADIGKIEHQELWHYEQALSEIKEMLETEPQRMRGRWIDKSEGRIEGAWPYCSVCDDMSVERFDFCPNCGSYNGGEQDVNH